MKMITGNLRYLQEGMDKCIDYMLTDPEGFKASMDKQELKKKKLLSEGYILESNGCYYKEQDILAGKCPLNGTLYNMGYRPNKDGTWRKASDD